MYLNKKLVYYIYFFNFVLSLFKCFNVGVNVVKKNFFFNLWICGEYGVYVFELLLIIEVWFIFSNK